MNRNIDLLAIGNPCADIVVRTARMPGWDDKCVGEAVGTFAGGTEANVACAASRLGLATAVFGDVGSDAHAQFLLDEFERFGVDTTWVARRADAASATTAIFVSPEGERSIVWVPMAPTARPDLETALRRTRVAYTMPYDADALDALARSTHAAGAELAIDIEREGAGRPGRLEAFLHCCDVAFMNESGFSTATGTAPDATGLASLLASGRAHTVVVTMGARGAMAIDATGFATHPAFDTEVVDTTGAGDAFNAAFLAARSRDATLQRALAFACAAASRTVARMGARSGLPTWNEVGGTLARTGSPRENRR